MPRGFRVFIPGLGFIGFITYLLSLLRLQVFAMPLKGKALLPVSSSFVDLRLRLHVYELVAVHISKYISITRRPHVPAYLQL